MATFEDRKRAVLGNICSGCDNSAIGKIDAKVIDLCAIINGSADYVTTSSCSGRSLLHHHPPPPFATSFPPVNWIRPEQWRGCSYGKLLPLQEGTFGEMTQYANG